MIAPISALIALSAVASTQAAFTIVYPSASAYWVANSSNTYQWTTAGNDNPSLFSVYISNVQSGVILTNNGAAQLGLSNNIDAASGTVQVPFLPDYVIGDGFVLQFTNVYNASDVFATSSAFTVQPKGTTYAQTSDVAPGNSGQFATVTANPSTAGVVVRTSAGGAAASSSNGGAAGGIPNAGGASGSAAPASNTGSNTTPASSGSSSRASNSASQTSAPSSASRIASCSVAAIAFVAALFL